MAAAQPTIPTSAAHRVGRKCLYAVDDLRSFMAGLRREPLSRKGLVALLARWPWMTLKVLLGIYWQALRLFIKRTPIFIHPESR